jgi:hypothetical protein
MNVTGEELYELYVEANDTISCGVDDWKGLDERDHEVWNYMASQLQPIPIE